MSEKEPEKESEKEPEKESEEKTDFQLKRLTADELRTFIDDFVSGRIWTSAHTPADLLPMVFMPIALGAFRNYTAESLADNIGVIYEYMTSAGPRSINGCPMFTSLRVLHKKDWQRAVRAIERESTSMSRYQRYIQIRTTATRILFKKDTQPNRSAAYIHALAKADVIALRCVQERQEKS